MVLYVPFINHNFRELRLIWKIPVILKLIECNQSKYGENGGDFDFRDFHILTCKQKKNNQHHLELMRSC